MKGAPLDPPMLLIQWSSGRAPLEVTFFAAVKSFDTNFSIIGNFVLNAKKTR